MYIKYSQTCTRITQVLLVEILLQSKDNLQLNYDLSTSENCASSGEYLISTSETIWKRGPILCPIYRSYSFFKDNILKIDMDLIQSHPGLAG